MTMQRLFTLSGIGIWLAAFSFCVSLIFSLATHEVCWLVLFGFATFILTCLIIIFLLIKPLVK
jgi:hypothetical protein